MKKLLQNLTSFVQRQTIAPQPEIPVEFIHQLKPDYELIRFSIWLHFRSRHNNGRYLLAYEQQYATIVEGLQKEGWRVSVLVGPDGDLAYKILPVSWLSSPGT